MAPNNALAKSEVDKEEKEEEEEVDAKLFEKSVISSKEVQARGDGVNARQVQTSSFVVKEVLFCLTAVMFLTRLPCPRWVDHNPKSLVPGMAYFTVIGSFVGLWVSVWFEALSLLWSPLIAATASTLAGVWITGCFHEDGLADTLDSFGGGWSRTQILRIMKDSRVGTYALVGTCLMIVSKVSLLSQIAEEGGIAATRAALVCAHTCSRCTSLWLVKVFPYVHDDGDDKMLYNSFAGCLRRGLLSWGRILISSGYTFGATTFLLGINRALEVTLVLFVIIVGSGKYGTSVIGGVIGDYLGATIILTEVVIYMFLAANWEGLKLSATSYDDIAMPLLRLVVAFGIPSAFMHGAGPIPKSNEC